MIHWFGPSWGAPMCEPKSRILLPIGRTCIGCKDPFEPSARGVRLPLIEGTDDAPRASLCYWHLDCFLEHLGIKTRLPLP